MPKRVWTHAGVSSSLSLVVTVRHEFLRTLLLSSLLDIHICMNVCTSYILFPHSMNICMFIRRTYV